ncbi:MAG: LysM peptidoglycan-binding domain-containing protein [Novosphingobium sp.]|nr:LysM peptidoglycan-binding domain-containing protein [Novosphingobium sp.]MCP5401234.1 LysM peptidoglycan-binding domain-containing protein [Novosphingobium sp.]
MLAAASPITVLAAPDPATETVHTVTEGETLNGVANRAGVARDSIIEANGLEPPFVIRIGQKLKIPRDKPGASSSATASTGQGSEHVVEEGETLNGIANRAGVARDRIIEANGLEPPYVIRIGQTLKIPGGSGSAPASSRSASPSGSTAPELATEHVVKEGETLGGIANRAQVPRVLIAEANGLTEPYIVKVGQKLKIPRTRRHTVKEGETGFSIAYAYGVPWNAIAVATGIDPDASLQPGRELLIPTVIDRPSPSTASPAATSPAPAPTPTPAPAAASASRFAWPVSGSIRRGFTPREQSNYHDGLDIQAQRGAAVRATGAGKVIFADKKGSYGNLVILSHGDGWHSVYGYLDRITVKVGEQVGKGERIGLVGNTGIAKGDELHFELRRNNKPVDPTSELPAGP